MIFITAKMTVKPEFADDWPDITREFTEAARAEPGNLWFEWSRSIDDPNTWVLVEAFQDDAAEAHVNSDHFKAAQETLPPHLVETPKVVNFQVDGEQWSELGELAVE